ncbi:hypothetical protein JCM19046_2881 [Bacillus sp. JCM 19046]|nr:hypothetical protein JCM19046_2881 [Bacillus sp. JCM 19046]
MNLNSIIENGKKYGFVAFVAFLLLALVLRSVSDNADRLLAQLHRLMGQPFHVSFLRYSDSQHDLVQMLQFILLSVLYASLAVGIYTLVRFFIRRQAAAPDFGYSSRVVIEERLSELIHSIEENKHISIIQQNLQHYFDGLSVELAKVLNVKPKDFPLIGFIQILAAT